MHEAFNVTQIAKGILNISNICKLVILSVESRDYLVLLTQMRP